MLTTVILSVTFIILIILGGYFGGAETAFTAVNRIKMKALAEGGDRRAKAVLSIVDKFDLALTTLLIGNNITHIGAGAVSVALVLHLWDNGEGIFGNISQDTASFLYGTVIATVLVFLFAEMIPKSKANDRCDTLALRYAHSLRFLMKAFYPLSCFFGLISKTVSRLFAAAPEPTITEDELYDIIDTAQEEGVMDQAQGDLLRSALDFSGTTVGDVMTMREDLVCADINLSREELVRSLRQFNHSRIPVYEGTMDRLVGILNIRTFFKTYMKDPNFDIRRILTPPYIVSPTDLIEDLFPGMRQGKHYIAVVKQEDRVVGLVTIEDFLEEIVGEIWDEDDVVDHHFIRLGGNRFFVDTSLTLGEVYHRMKQRLPERRLANRPVLDWVLENFGRFPEADACFTYHNVEITVADIEDNVVDPESGRLDRVVFRILPEVTAQAPSSPKETEVGVC